MKKRLFALFLAICLVVSLVPAVSAAGVFADVDPDEWYGDEVAYVYEEGLMNGVDAVNNLFDPTGATSRAMIWTILGRMDGETISGAAWAEVARQWAMTNGVSDGTNPDTAITREQLAAMLYRYAVSKDYDVSVGEDTNILSYPDAFDVTEYAIPAMQWAVGAGIITNLDGKLAPQTGAQRCMVAVMLYRFCENVVKAEAEPEPTPAPTPTPKPTPKPSYDDWYSPKVLTVREPGTVENDWFDYVIIDKRVGDGTVTLNNVTIYEELIVEGGGQNTVKLIGCAVDLVTMAKEIAGETVRLLLENTPVAKIEVTHPAIIETAENDTASKITEVKAEAELTVKGETTQVETVAAVAPVAVVNGSIDKVETAANVTVTGGTVAAIATDVAHADEVTITVASGAAVTGVDAGGQGTTVINNGGEKIENVKAEAPVEVKAGEIKTIDTSANVTVTGGTVAAIATDVAHADEVTITVASGAAVTGVDAGGQGTTVINNGGEAIESVKAEAPVTLAGNANKVEAAAPVEVAGGTVGTVTVPSDVEAPVEVKVSNDAKVETVEAKGETTVTNTSETATVGTVKAEANVTVAEGKVDNVIVPEVEGATEKVEVTVNKDATVDNVHVESTNGTTIKTDNAESVGGVTTGNGVTSENITVAPATPSEGGDDGETETPTVHVHVWATTYSKDETHHWYACVAADCDGTKKDETAHSWGTPVEADNLNHTYTCVCGATKVANHAYTRTLSADETVGTFTCACGRVETEHYVAKIGSTYYETVEAAIENGAGKTITLLTKIDDPLVFSGSNTYTLDLNSQTVEANGCDGVIRAIEGATLTINGSGNVVAVMCTGATHDPVESNCGYAMAVWAKNGTVTINGGSFSQNAEGRNEDETYDLIYASASGKITINGGEFESVTPDWTLNIRDGDRATTSISVTGGTFKSYDPSNSVAEGAGTNFLAPGYVSTEEDGVYTVDSLFAGGSGTQNDPFQISTSEEFSNIHYYEAANSGAVKTYYKLTANVTADHVHYIDGWGYFTITNMKNAEFDGNGYTISMKKHTEEDVFLFYDVRNATFTDLNVSNAAGPFMVYGVNDTFDDVDISGAFSVGNNIGAYVIYAGGDVAFEDCNPNITMIGDGAKSSYNAVFVGYNWKSNLSFTNCTNEGSLICGTAAMFLGNRTYNALTLTITNCQNNGLIQSTYDGSGGYYYNHYIAAYIKGEHSTTNPIVDGTAVSLDEPVACGSAGVFIKGPHDATLAITHNSDDTFTVTHASNEAVAYYNVTIALYATYVEGGSGLFGVNEKIIAAGSEMTTCMKTLSFVDETYLEGLAEGSYTQESASFNSEVQIITVGGTEYYLLTDDELTFNGNIKSNYFVSVSAYAEDGTLLASTGMSN